MRKKEETSVHRLYFTVYGSGGQSKLKNMNPFYFEWLIFGWKNFLNFATEKNWLTLRWDNNPVSFTWVFLWTSSLITFFCFDHKERQENSEFSKCKLWFWPQFSLLLLWHKLLNLLYNSLENSFKQPATLIMLTCKLWFFSKIVAIHMLLNSKSI